MALARETATFSRFKLQRKSSPLGASSGLELLREKINQRGFLAAIIKQL
jgi:hypothetical protein